MLPSRGALFPALQAIGLCPRAVRRAWAAFRSGEWQITELLRAWESYVLQQKQWQAHQYEGYYPKAVDLTAYWRPTLKGCQTKHYYPPAEKALPAIVLGLIGRVGSVNGQRLALLTALVRADPADPAEATLQQALVQQVATTLAADEMPVFDAGFKIGELQAADLPRFVVRLAKNFTARRNVLPVYQGHGRRPEYGERARPLARAYKGRGLLATPPDRQETWTEHGIQFRAEFWDNLSYLMLKCSLITRPLPWRLFMIPAIASRAYSLVPCGSRLRPGGAYIGIAGPSNRSPWLVNKCLGEHASLSLPRRVVSVCLNSTC